MNAGTGDWKGKGDVGECNSEEQCVCVCVYYSYNVISVVP